LEKVKLEASQSSGRTPSTPAQELIEAVGVLEVSLQACTSQRSMTIGIKVHRSLTCLDGSPLNVPLTQDPGPMTEDMLKAKEAELMAMGESEDAATTRAHVQVGAQGAAVLCWEFIAMHVEPIPAI